MTDPARAERLWLALAVGTWWCLVVGGDADAAVRIETVPPVPTPTEADQTAASPRPVSVSLRGLALIVAGLLAGTVPWGVPNPDAWPMVMPTPNSHELAPPGQKT